MTNSTGYLIPHLVLYTETGGVGGAERYLMELVRRAPGVAARTTLCASDLPGNAPLFELGEQEGIECVPLRPASHLGRGLASFRLLRASRPSLIHFSCIGTASCQGAVGAAIALGVPFVVTEHMALDRPVGGWKYRLYRRLLAHHAGGMIAVSSAVRERLAAYHATPPEKVSVIYNGIGPEFFAPRDEVRAAYRNDFGIGDSEVVFVVVGSLVEHKKPRLAIDAFASLPAAERGRSRLLLVGTGPMEGELRRYVADRGIGDRVRLLGYRADVASLLKMADVFLMTSLDEACSLAVLEAMASRLPVLTTSSGGMLELVRDGETGFNMASGDPGALSRRIVEMIRDPALRDRMGAAGHVRARAEFDVEAMVQRTTAMYRQVAKAPGGAMAPGIPEPTAVWNGARVSSRRAAPWVRS